MNTPLRDRAGEYFLELQERICADFGYKLVHHSLQIFGLCPACKDKSDEGTIRNRVAQLHT